MLLDDGLRPSERVDDGESTSLVNKRKKGVKLVSTKEIKHWQKELKGLEMIFDSWNCKYSLKHTIHTNLTNIFTFYTNSGIMKIGQEYISLAAHLSNQACKKVQELSRSLPPVMKVTKHSKLKAWPKRWEASSEPTAESIGLYFFSDNMRCVAYPMHTSCSVFSVTC